MDTAIYILRWLAALALLFAMLGLWTAMIVDRFPFWRGAGLVLLLQAAMLGEFGDFRSPDVNKPAPRGRA